MILTKLNALLLGIMSDDQIQQKKSLVLNNRIKRAAHIWTPLELEREQHDLLDTISHAFRETNIAPDTNEIRVSFYESC